MSRSILLILYPLNCFHRWPMAFTVWVIDIIVARLVRSVFHNIYCALASDSHKDVWIVSQAICEAGD